MKKTQSNRLQSNRAGANGLRVSRSLVLATAVAAAVGAITMLAPATFAQQRVAGDGRLMDASNRVGSGGLNDNSASALPPGVFGNSIVTGNVTGGRGFSGNQIPYFDPGAFHAVLPGSFVDNFVSGSTNVQTNGTVVNNSQNVHLYLGDNRGVNPPSNFVSTGAQPGYIPNALSSNQFTSDTRLGAPESSPISSAVPSAIFQTGGTQMGSAQSTYVTASSLFGVKTLQTSQQNDGNAQTAGSALGDGPLNTALGTGDRIDLSADARAQALNQLNNPGQGPLADSALSGLPPGVGSYATPRTSLSNGLNGAANTSGSPISQKPNAAGTNADGSGSNDGLNDQSPNGIGPASNGAVPNRAIDASINTQVSAAVPSGYPLSSTVGGSAFSGGLKTGEGNSTNIYSKDQSWKQPDSAYQRMLVRLKSINPNAPLSTEQKNLLNQAKSRDIKAAADKEADKGTTPAGGIGSGANSDRAARGSGAGQAGLGSTPGSFRGSIGGASGGPTPGSTGSGQLTGSGALPAGPVVPQQGSPAADKNKPVFINSLSSDATSPEVKQHLAQAEALMKQGKFTSALEEYDLVEQQSPSNPYTQLGRANAELGASYYGLSEAHLRQAFMSDQALLQMQLDLHSFLGEDKLQYLVKDLKQIAQANPTESRPVFLLAYICYNTSNPRGAAAYLDLAEKREGKADPFFRLVRQNWDLPSIGDEKGDTGLNK